MNMEKTTLEDLKNALIFSAGRIVESEPMLTELDTKIGDGDHGFAMKSGFEGVREMLGKKFFETSDMLLKETGITLLKIMGGTSGVIFGTLFIGGLQKIAGKKEMTAEDWDAYLTGGKDAIARRGKTSRGDKTMFDALAEACDRFHLAASEKKPLEECFASAAEGAEYGMEQTKTMISRKGRSKHFGNSTMNYPDAGALSTSIFFRGLSDYFNQSSR